MKRLFSIIAMLLVIGTSFTSCVEEIAAPNEEPDFSRCLVPTELTYKIVEGETIEFSWSETKGATAFVLEVYTDAEYSTSPVVKEERLIYEELPYVADLEPDMIYYARVKAIDESGDLEDSKWGEYKPIETFAVRPTANPDLIERTVNSITVGWDLPEGDTELDHIRVSPPIGDDEEYTKFPLTAEDVATGEYEVTGLDASVQYTLALHFKSANRGSVTAWTRPLIDGATTVSDTAAFKQAVKDGASTILLAYADTVYNVGDLTLTAPLKLYGDSSTDGVNPTVAGTLTVPAGVTSLYVEGISFDGQGYTYGHLINLGEGVTITDITLKNCTQTSYSKGIFYNNDKPNGKVDKITFDGILVQDIQGNGGDFFDIRNNNGQYGEIVIKNSTFTIGMRTAFRIDLGAEATPTKVNSFKISNCTFNNLCFVDNGNNNGLFNVRAQVAEFSLSECVFLNMNDEKERCALISKQGTAAVPKLANNFFYNCYDRFFVPNTDWSKVEKDKQEETINNGIATIVVNGSQILNDDPCIDSQRDVLNVTNADILEAKAGDPRWYEAYVPVVEDLTQNVTSTGKVWDLTDGQTFKKLADKDMVRDDIRFYVQNTPINFIETGFEFTGAGVVEVSSDKETGLKTEVPVDGAIGIKVNEPGHLYMSTAASESGNTSTPLVVNVDGVAVGSVSVGAVRSQICLSDLAEGEHTIYIYPASGAVVLTELEWDGCTLDSPEVTINKTSIMAGTSEKVTLTWLHVDQADSYQVTIGENVVTTKENSYTFSAESLKLADGVYNIEVVAVPATDEHIASYPGTVKLTVEVAEDPVVRVETLWDGAYFEEAIAKYFPDYESGNITENFSYKKLRFVANDGRTDGKFSTGTGDTGYYIGIGGSGKLVDGDGKNYIQFTAGGPGKLTLKATSSGDPRNISVAVNGEEIGKYEIPSKADAPAEHVIELSTVENDLVYIYSPSSGIRIYEIKWEPAAAGSGIPSDPTAIEETYFMELTADNGFEKQSIADGNGPVTIDKLTFGDNSELDGNRFKHKGASVLGDDGIPVNRYVSFKITTPGTISHKVISGSSSAADRAYAVILVTNAGGVKTVKELYNEYAPTSSSSDPVTTEVTADMLAGVTETATVYIYTLANCNTYAVGYDPAPAVPAPVDLVWDFSASEWVNAMTNSGIASNTNDSNWDLEVNGLKVISGGSSIKWNVSGETYYWQPGGKSDGTNRYFEFTTEVAGKLSVYASNTGSSEDLTRMVTVQVGEGEPVSQPGGYPTSDGPHQLDFTIDAGTVKIYPTGNGLRFYKIEFHSN